MPKNTNKTKKKPKKNRGLKLKNRISLLIAKT